ncbi:cupin domain-containing protein [Halorubrum sp. JWXQ-INN 858]|uniref:cupin domain-containing protein n=1 Tax=Halorubrum sp. JWXQ-INN 858 TaxID=2690782 RepID=UPI0013586BAB|nr:cupin domain-containing protein [Halorubrum sp. JWXQ-INN 858]MWV65206.1 cupin domain-containing protein [Halorubrum sp. JWXQ-INN 858]
MRRVTIDDVDVVTNPLGVHDVRKPVSRALGTEHVAMNYFELAPGDAFAGGLHAHGDQEEVFYVLSGVATFEVGRERERVDVGAGELIRFAPGEFQSGFVREDATEPVVAWAFGAPGARHDWDAIETIADCRTCDEERAHRTALTDDGRFRFTCVSCGTSFSP